MKKTLSILIILVIVALGVWLLTRGSSQTATDDKDGSAEILPPPHQEQEVTLAETVIGTSVEGRDIVAYHYPPISQPAETDSPIDTELLFVGGIHGGYEWNTSLVAFEAMDYFEENPDAIAGNIRVTVIPVLNPDGLYEIVGTAGRFSAEDAPASLESTVPGRFNANNVDLNRNFDCDWQPEGVWQDKTVSGGDAVFSEPESQALRDYVEGRTPDAVVVWYSAVGGVFASNCHEGVLPETNTLTELYADASGYRAYQEFDFYTITGDAVNWLAKEGIPGISVLLTTHDDTEWSKNQAGIEAVLAHYAN